MILKFKNNYEGLTDRELVEMTTKPMPGMTPNEESVAYLLYNRYAPLLHKLYQAVFNNWNDFYDDCVDDLFEYLKNGNPAWRKLINLEWRCSFGTWLGITARHRFLEIKPSLIGKADGTLSIDEEQPVQLPDGGIEEYEDKERKVILMEAISLLKDEDQKFVIIKRLQGYNSNEIASLLRERWAKRGIVKYNNKKQVVVPDAAYVDVRSQRAKDNLQIIIKSLM